MNASAQSTDRASPHTSPRFSRRSTTPNLMAVQNDLYSGSIPTLSLANSSSNYISAATAVTGGQQHAAPSAPPLNAMNGITTQKSTNRMSAPLMGTGNSILAAYGTKVSSGITDNADNSNSSYAILQNLQESQAMVSKEVQKREANSVAVAAAASIAPPLPPRKSSPGSDNSASSSTGTNMASPPPSGLSNGHGKNSQISKSIDSINSTFNDICVPITTAPPIPPHSTANTSSSHVDSLMEELRSQRLTTANTSFSIVSPSCTVSTNNAPTPTAATTSLLDDDIVGPAETIMGVIDTRPLEARSQISTGNYTQLCTATTIVSGANSIDVNRSDLKANHQEGITKLSSLKQQQQQFQSQPQQLLLYENVSLNAKHGAECNVPYENINLEYIARLMNEGYSKENAITALGISRNNIEMACDILREFVSKSTT